MVAGIAERDGERLFNSAVVAGPKGYVGTFRRSRLWNEGNICFEPGDKSGSTGLPIGLQVIGRFGADCQTLKVAWAHTRSLTGAVGIDTDGSPSAASSRAASEVMGRDLKAM